MICASCKRKSGESSEWYEGWYRVFGEEICAECWLVLMPPDLLSKGFWVSPAVFQMVPGGAYGESALRASLWPEKLGASTLWGVKRAQ